MYYCLSYDTVTAILGTAGKIIGNDAIRAYKNGVRGAIENYTAVMTAHEAKDFG